MAILLVSEQLATAIVGNRSPVRRLALKEGYRSGHNGPVSKTGRGETLTWVRIPPLPFELRENGGEQCTCVHCAWGSKGGTMLRHADATVSQGRAAARATALVERLTESHPFRHIKILYFIVQPIGL